MNKSLLTACALTLTFGGYGYAIAGSFGGADDVQYAAKLWKAMTKDKLVGDSAVMSTPYTGVHPHGAILDTIESTTTVNGKTGIVIVKRNYGGEGVSKNNAGNNPKKYLKAVTVMYKRAGYDPDNKDWFWVKYAPNGSVLQNPDKMSLAGRVGKGGTAGCVPCHAAAPGGDMVFNHDRYMK